MNYELAYRVGFHPWEDAEDQPRFRAKLSELLTAEEQAWNRPYGRALDLGTGSGIWGVELARRGWQVAGVDIVERALERARVRAVEAGGGIELVRGNVTGLQRAGGGTGFCPGLDTRSGKHTSETQSPSKLVCRLLLL